ncbi:hypothetical protein HYALB_00010085 [Hymenoscyphus albidus]|uniref:Uncharacterized protein n=1 Tax=Hymenoscyphus albidus TaxID=595503 RepID=A0A9N9PZK1_9HELO|nr:hypothetical protein HYALB_00010085 [Hymenoscyphus albidus]
MVYTLEDQHELAPQKRIWHRTTFFNACVIGGVGFIAPGLWNAMNSLRAGGTQAPYLVNPANALGNVWLVLVGAVTCGVSAGLFWASEGAVALGYPESSKRGKYLKQGPDSIAITIVTDKNSAFGLCFEPEVP